MDKLKTASAANVNIATAISFTLVLLTTASLFEYAIYRVDNYLFSSQLDAVSTMTSNASLNTNNTPKEELILPVIPLETTDTTTSFFRLTYLLSALIIASLFGLLVRRIVTHAKELELTVKTRTLYLENLAYQDSLTGLLNRRAFIEQAQELLDQSHTTGATQQILLLDLNDFKLINDTHGHDVGDELLLQIAYRLTRVLPYGTTLARLGGDEFVISAENMGRQECIRNVVEPINEAMINPVKIGDLRLRVSLSIGISPTSTSDTELSDLLRSADLDMYRAKRLYKSVAASVVAKPDFSNTRELKQLLMSA